MKDTIIAPNYTPHAIVDLIELRNGLMPLTAATKNRIGQVIGMLEDGVKVLLPPCGDLIEPDHFEQKHLDIARLPFPITVFEVPWPRPPRMGEGLHSQVASTRRIALAWEPTLDNSATSLASERKKLTGEEGFNVLTLFYADDEKAWRLCPLISYISYETLLHAANEPGLYDNVPGVDEANAVLAAEGLIKANAPKLDVGNYDMMPEISELMQRMQGVSYEEARAALILDSRDETWVTIQACTVMNAANVTTSILPAPSKLNKKRVAKGQLPLYEYHVLQLHPQKEGVGKARGGSHTSPREHLRRGHLRRYKKTDKTIWVSATIVNSGSRSGTIEKAYQVPPTPRK